MKLVEFAALVGVSRQAVWKACTSKRLDRSITRDAQGRVVSIDPEIGRREWVEAKRPQHFDAAVARDRVETAVRAAALLAAPASNVAPILVFGGLDPLEPGWAFVGIHVPLDRFLAGAAAALGEAGEQATPAALQAVAEGLGEEAWWVAITGALNAALDPAIPAGDLPGMWEAEGREAVAAARAERHGG